MVTAEYHVTDIESARSFYAKLLGRGPDFEASPTFVDPLGILQDLAR